MGHKHTKIRQRELNCARCGIAFVTGSSIQDMCSPECRVAALYTMFPDPQACWEWPKSRNPVTGYGQLSTWANGKRVLMTAHRVSYVATHGALSNGAFVLHRCDNRACFNPAHLFLGTQQDNMQDMVQKNRHNPTPPPVPWQRLHPERIPRGDRYTPRTLPVGSAHHMAKITEADAAAIKASSASLAHLSRQYGISAVAVGNIRKGKTWRHVTAQPA